MLSSFWFWIALYASALFAFVLWRPTASGDRDDFFLSLRWPLRAPLLVLTFAATLFSAFFMVGIPGFVYTHGLGTWPYIIFGDVLGMAILFIVGRQVLRRTAGCKAVSPLALFSRTPLYTALFLVITTAFVLPYLAVQIGGFGRLVESATEGGIGTSTGAFLVLAFMYLYTFAGGIRAMYRWHRSTR